MLETSCHCRDPWTCILKYPPHTLTHKHTVYTLYTAYSTVYSISEQYTHTFSYDAMHVYRRAHTYTHECTHLPCIVKQPLISTWGPGKLHNGQPTNIKGYSRLAKRKDMVCISKQCGSQMAEWLGSRVSNQKVAGSIPGRANDVVTLCQALHPTCLWGNVTVLTVSRSG